MNELLYNLTLTKEYLEPVLPILVPFIIVSIIVSLIPGYSKHRYNIKLSKKLLKKLRSFENEGQVISYLKKIDPFVFEELLLTAFKDLGWKIKRNLRYTGDGGIDGKVKNRNYGRFLIQAKRYRNYIRPQHIHDFQEVLDKKLFWRKGLFIHTGKTGSRSHEAVDNKRVKIISGGQLVKLINRELPI